MTRNIGMHAGGVLIAPGKLTDFCPLYQSRAATSAVSMFDKDDVERCGLVKFDFLGLATLTILEMAREFIAQTPQGRRKTSTLSHIPLDDCGHLQAVSRTARPRPCSSLNPPACRACCKEAKPTPP